MPLQPQRQQQLLHFPLRRARICQKKRLRHLLSQRGPALHDPPRGHVDPRRAQQPDRIDAGVVPEPPILHRDDRFRQGSGEILQPQRLTHQIAERRDDMP